MAIEIPVTVSIPHTPELCAQMFVGMDSVEQAKVLSMIWDGMRSEYDGEFNAAVQCHYIGDEIRKDTAATQFMETIMYNEEPKGFVLPVNREATTAELMDAKRFIDKRLGLEDATQADPEEQVLNAALGVISTRLDYGTEVHKAPSGHEGRTSLAPRMTCTIKQQDPPLGLGDNVTLEGFGKVGRVTKVNIDDTVLVIVDQTYTGRISCAGPNLQNMPTRKSENWAQVAGLIPNSKTFSDSNFSDRTGKCDECGGTGIYVGAGIGPGEPCSRGCRA